MVVCYSPSRSGEKWNWWLSLNFEIYNIHIIATKQTRIFNIPYIKYIISHWKGSVLCAQCSFSLIFLFFLPFRMLNRMVDEWRKKWKWFYSFNSSLWYKIHEYMCIWCYFKISVRHRLLIEQVNISIIVSPAKWTKINLKEKTKRTKKTGKIKNVSWWLVADGWSSLLKR